MMSSLHAYVIVLYISVSCSLWKCYIGLKTTIKCANHGWRFSQAVDWKLLLHIELRNAEEQHHRASTRVVLCPQLVKTTLDMTELVSFLLSVKNKGNMWLLKLLTAHIKWL